jgi:hypothetical protein
MTEKKRIPTVSLGFGFASPSDNSRDAHSPPKYEPSHKQSVKSLAISEQLDPIENDSGRSESHVSSDPIVIQDEVDEGDFNAEENQSRDVEIEDHSHNSNHQEELGDSSPNANKNRSYGMKADSPNASEDK